MYACFHISVIVDAVIITFVLIKSIRLPNWLLPAVFNIQVCVHVNTNSNEYTLPIDGGLCWSILSSNLPTNWKICKLSRLNAVILC